MREIKFRGLHKGAMVYGNYIKAFYDGKPFYQIEHSDSDELLRWEIENPETIGQFTGLKDVNGVDIYEGDIIENKGQFIGAVRFLDGYFVTSWIDYKFKDVTESKIIGNIHENPELLGWGD